MIFQWDDRNTAHIAEHGVSRTEAEFVIRHAKSPFPEDRGAGKFLVWGTTANGDYLQVVFVFPPDEEIEFRRMPASDVAGYLDGEEVIYVIHAMPLTANKKSRFKMQKRKKGRK